MCVHRGCVGCQSTNRQPPTTSHWQIVFGLTSHETRVLTIPAICEHRGAPRLFTRRLDLSGVDAFYLHVCNWTNPSSTGTTFLQQLAPGDYCTSIHTNLAAMSAHPRKTELDTLSDADRETENGDVHRCDEYACLQMSCPNG